MRYYIELLDKEFRVVRILTPSYPSLRRAMVKACEFQLNGNVQIRRDDGHSYSLTIYEHLAIAESNITGFRYFI